MSVAKNSLQIGNVERLHEVMIKACLFGAAAVFFLAPAGESHESYVLSPRLLPQVPRDFIAVHFRQANIEHDQVGPKMVGRDQSFLRLNNHRAAEHPNSSW